MLETRPDDPVSAASSGYQCEPVRSCPVCNSEKHRLWQTGHDRLYSLSKEEFPYSQCADCGVIYLSWRPVQQDIGFFYPQNYGPYQSLAPEQAKSQKNPFWPVPKALGRLLVSVLKPINRLFDKVFRDRYPQRFKSQYERRGDAAVFLDFGCGSDKFLNKCREQGWQRTIGFDFTPSVIEKVCDSGHEGYLVTQDNAWDAVESGSVDFIRMNHVLEHLYTPVETLRRLQGKMKPGAVLHIALPNPDSWTAKVFGTRWFSLEAPRHIVHYSPRVLRTMLENLGGFDVVAELQETHPKDVNRSIGYFWMEKGWLSYEEQMAWMTTHPLLSEVFHIPLRVAALMGQSDRYHLFVRKRGGPDAS